ncbi:MAG: arginine-tRNA-protein transferase [Saprospiraceae bacterium]
MIPIFADKHYPSETMSPEALDAYLAKGWYRMGQTIFTTHFLCFQQHFYSAIWVRLELADYQFGKRARKLLRRNARQFRYEFKKGKIDREKERLYQRYRRSFPGMLAPSLKDSLLDGEDQNIYNSLEVAIYDGEKLIAFSFFDLGQESAASILGVYDPDYDRYSLGYYTMLLEIQYCLDQELEYYYPGYVVPGYSRFDYKLRIGDVEYFDLASNKWEDFSELAEEDIPIKKMEMELQQLYRVFRQHNIPCHIKHYPLFESNLFGFWQAPYFDYPILMHCFPQSNASRFVIAVFDVRHNCYHLLQCSLLEDFQFFFNESYIQSFDPSRFFTELLVVNRYIKSDDTAEALLAFILENVRTRKTEE